MLHLSLRLNSHFQSNFAKADCRKIENKPIALTSGSWVQITATFDNFARLACRADKMRRFKIRMIKHVCFWWDAQYFRRKMFAFKCTLSNDVSLR